MNYPLPASIPAEDLPRLVIDTREQTPLVFTRLSAERGGLYSADYSIAGLTEYFGIERKSVADFVACCTGQNRERFHHELHRLRGYTFARLLVVGTKEEIVQGNYRSRIKPQCVLATLSAVEARYCPVVFTADPAEAALIVECWAAWFHREFHPARRRATSTSTDR